MHTQIADATTDAYVPRAQFLRRAGFEPAISAADPILMVEPEFFSVEYAINPWMQRGRPVDAALARMQWANLKRHIDGQVRVETMAGVVGLPDLCFSANAGLVFKDLFIPSNFRHMQRRPETVYFERYFAERGYVIERMPSHLHFEGAGDALFDRNGVLWMGYGQRSCRRAAAWLKGALDCSVHALALKDPDFYHLDTCFCALESGHVVYHPGAFTTTSLEIIRSEVPSRLRIEVDRGDAMGFACNMIELPDAVVTSHASSHLRTRLAEAGKVVVIVPMEEFIKAGGGAKCLSLRLPRHSRKVDGKACRYP